MFAPRDFPDRSFRLALLPAIVLAAMCLAGCARLSVSHLEARPVATVAPTALDMKFWRFEFTGTRQGKNVVLHGRTSPVMEHLPPWVDRLEELTLTAYLRDTDGNVLASAEKRYKGMALGADAAIPFEFILRPDGASSGSAAVSFGYKAVYGSQTARKTLAVTGPSPASAVFFAGEGAVLKQ